jgi:hypothetical protein
MNRNEMKEGGNESHCRATNVSGRYCDEKKAHENDNEKQLKNRCDNENLVVVDPRIRLLRHYKV